MPRLSPSTIRHAFSISPFLPFLLRPCRTLSAAQNELRWLQEHALDLSRSNDLTTVSSRSILLKLCMQRSNGVPLQYVLGSQPFGELDILCRPGVLIPRPETEVSTSHLATLVEQESGFDAFQPLKVLDLCTGTGCIPLLLHFLLAPKFSPIQVVGVDISSRALALANENLKHNIDEGYLRSSASSEVSFAYGDILEQSLHWSKFVGTHWDIVTCNPPYISERGFKIDTSRSVRNYEPKLALVPPPATTHMALEEDQFYPIVLDIASTAKARLVFMEVSDTEQALRVAKYASDKRTWKTIEIWRDSPDQPTHDGRDTLSENNFKVKGAGHGRSVVCKAW